MPVATKYGVPAQMFWQMNPKRLNSWQIQYNERIQDEEDRMDRMAWIIGGYVARAIGAAFNGRKSPYPRMPDNVKQYRDNARAKAEHDAAKFAEWAITFNKQFEAKQK